MSPQTLQLVAQDQASLKAQSVQGAYEVSLPAEELPAIDGYQGGKSVFSGM